eukprot:UN00904
MEIAKRGGISSFDKISKKYGKTYYLKIVLQILPMSYPLTMQINNQSPLLLT